MKRTVLISASIITLTLTGCSAEGTSVSPTVESPAASATSSNPITDMSASGAPSVNASASETSPVSAPAESERGNLIKQVGEPAGIGNGNGDPIVEFTIESMTVDPKCTGESKEKAENGHLILLEVSAQTYKNVDDVNSDGWSLNPYNFKVIKKDGITSNAPASSNAGYVCFNENKYLPTMGDAERAAGYVVLDVEEPAGTLVYEEGSTGSGWEWEYPAK